MSELASWATGSDTNRIMDVEEGRGALATLLTPSSVSNQRPRDGWLPGPTAPGAVTAAGTPNGTVTVAAFQRVMNNSRGTYPYLATLSAPKTLDVVTGPGGTPADPSNQRNDLIIAQQSDQFYSDGTSDFVVRRVTGTPAASPTDPTVTGSPDYVLLARIRVTANATAITNGMIDDLRPTPKTVPRGAILPLVNASDQATVPPVEGLVSYRRDTTGLYVANGSAHNLVAKAGLDARVDALAADTGLIDLPVTLGADWEVSSAVVKYRKIGKSLWMYCVLKRLNTAIDASAVGNVAGDPTLFTITTASLRPTFDMTAIGRATVTSGMIYIETTGVAKIGDLHSGSSIAVNQLLQFTSSWPVA